MELLASWKSHPRCIAKLPYFFFFEVDFFAAALAFVAGLPAAFFFAAMKFHLRSVFCFMRFA